MFNNDEVVAIIPARGGSKRLPRKNVLPISGKPCIAWTIEAAINSKFIDHVKRRHMMNDNMGNNEENKKYTEPGKYTKDFKTRKNDNTWAKEINLD